jgi:tRNA (guanosine-2'-O-)-methyltransferase
MQKKLLAFLSAFVTPARLALFEKVLNERTYYITVVLEDIFQPQNASAVLRSCDCFGVQDVHVIENRNEFTIDTEVALGASKWLSIHKYNKNENNSLDAVRELKKRGYRIIATTPHISEQFLPEFDVRKGKAALVFGSELPGISEAIMNEADEFLKIPMYGFTESLNLSVSAALALYHLSNKLRELKDVKWQLTEEEKTELELNWLRSTIKQSHLLEERFRRENHQGRR